MIRFSFLAVFVTTLIGCLEEDSNHPVLCEADADCPIREACLVQPDGTSVCAAPCTPEIGCYGPDEIPEPNDPFSAEGCESDKDCLEGEQCFEQLDGSYTCARSCTPENGCYGPDDLPGLTEDL